MVKNNGGSKKTYIHFGIHYRAKKYRKEYNAYRIYDIKKGYLVDKKEHEKTFVFFYEINIFVSKNT